MAATVVTNFCKNDLSRDSEEMHSAQSQLGPIPHFPPGCGGVRAEREVRTRGLSSYIFFWRLIYITLFQMQMSDGSFLYCTLTSALELVHAMDLRPKCGGQVTRYPSDGAAFVIQTWLHVWQFLQKTT